jgi:hypothetical protein
MEDKLPVLLRFVQRSLRAHVPVVLLCDSGTVLICMCVCECA